MHLSPRRRTSRTDNPFLGYVPPARRRPLMRRRSNQFPQPKRILGQFIGILLIFMVAFSLLPLSLQRTTLSWFGIQPTVSPAPSPLLPVAYSFISSPYGKRWGRMHQGIDFAAFSGTPIHAMASGTVTYSGWEPGYGKSIVLDHGNGTQTRYAHCARLLVKAGEPVKKGDSIAQVGSTGHSTGPHLHFEVLVHGVRKNPAWYYHFPGETSEPVESPSHTDLAQTENLATVPTVGAAFAASARF